MASRILAIISSAIIVLTSPAGAADAPVPKRAPAAGNTQFMLFNQTPAATYSVRRNNVAAGNVVAGPGGVIVYDTDAGSGDRYEFLMSGIVPVTPSAPSGLIATGGQQGCVSVTWNAPSPTDYVTGYSLLWKTGTGSYRDSVAIDLSDISRGAKWMAGQCGFADGTYTFALRAHNSFDRWSALSASSTTTITNENTQGPVPPANVKVTEASFGCANVTWTKSSDPEVVGYRVYFGTRPRTQSAYSDSLDAGSAASAQQCGLSQGNYYFAVRAVTAVGVWSAYSKEVSLAARGVDTAAPSITQRSPAPAATGVPINASIFFVTTDDKAGVDVASVTVRVNGTSQAFTTSSVTEGIAVQCDPPGDFAPDSDVQVSLTVADRATPANIATRTYSFHTGTTAVTDDDAPVATAVSPPAGATGVDPAVTIDARLDDAGLGVDLTSVQMTVNGTAVAFALSGDPASVHVRYRPSKTFAAESTVRVHVAACDRAQPAHCTTLDYSFDIRSANAALAGAGAIVPDGYWAGDPERPLEIRELPARWTVRIFDTSGTTVRRHENLADGATWTWNFLNEEGRQVAPALYFVRVTDANGAVQRSGRFLVQSPR